MMGSSNCMICDENISITGKLDDYFIGHKTWWVCRNCVDYGLIMLINKVKPNKEEMENEM